MIELEQIKWGADGLVPAIIQDFETKDVLMLGYMNQDTLIETSETRKVVFWSRSRSQRWLKGETSGNFLAVVTMSIDCDADALLVEVNPAGPTCHTGSRSCFGSNHD